MFRCIRSGLNSVPRHFSEVWMDAALRLGCDGAPQPELFLDPSEIKAARELLSTRLPGKSPLVAVAPFHGGNSCNLPPARYSAIAGRLAKACRVVVVGTEAEKARWPGIPRTPNAWESFGELPLRSVMAAIACADSLFCGSTGPLHVARALGTPTVTVFGPRPANAAAMWRNTNANAQTIIAAGPGRCPCGQGGPCVLGAAPADDEIVAAVEHSIGRGRSG
jgi:ADP-heptose:LPS heptosyltransferase